MSLDPEKANALILDRLSDYLKRPITEADLNQGYEALGADSMDMVALAFELEKAAEIKILPEVFLQYDTLRGALDAILADPRA